jgi:DNA polymerase-3 subunit gamma/tau
MCKAITKGTAMDVVEMDAASHRGIDDIRALCDAAVLAPIAARKKVYILDEAHMLTTEAANAFLKTLEEPPSHVIFILATTNPEKLPATIRSRAFNVSFQKASAEEIYEKLQKIVKNEKFEIDDDAVQEIAKKAGGAFRDAIKLLEEVTMGGTPVTKEIVKEKLEGKVDALEELFKAIEGKNEKIIITQIESLVKNGANPKVLGETLLEVCHESVLASVGMPAKTLQLKLSTKDLISLSQWLLKASKDKESSIPQMPLEVALIEWCEQISSTAHTIGSSSAATPVSKPAIPQTQQAPEGTDQKKTQNEPSLEKPASKLPQDSATLWETILLEVKKRNTSIEACLRPGTLKEITADTISVEVFYRFHKDRIEQSTNMLLLESICSEVMGKPMRVYIALSEKKPELLVPLKDTLTTSNEPSIIDAAKEIFGNGSI